MLHADFVISHIRHVIQSRNIKGDIIYISGEDSHIPQLLSQDQVLLSEAILHQAIWIWSIIWIAYKSLLSDFSDELTFTGERYLVRGSISSISMRAIQPNAVAAIQVVCNQHGGFYSFAGIRAKHDIKINGSSTIYTERIFRNTTDREGITTDYFDRLNKQISSTGVCDADCFSSTSADTHNTEVPRACIYGIFRIARHVEILHRSCVLDYVHIMGHSIITVFAGLNDINSDGRKGEVIIA